MGLSKSAQALELGPPCRIRRTPRVIAIADEITQGERRIDITAGSPLLELAREPWQVLGGQQTLLVVESLVWSGAVRASWHDDCGSRSFGSRPFLSITSPVCHWLAAKRCGHFWSWANLGADDV